MRAPPLRVLLLVALPAAVIGMMGYESYEAEDGTSCRGTVLGASPSFCNWAAQPR